ncbi:MAG: FKBP-type peptidyl-prolyl cis-trans isomerase [Bacteroidota bacterium]
MRNSVLAALLLFIMFTGSNCIKSNTCSPQSVSSEAPQIQAFATSSGINAIPHSSGLYYEIIDPGTGDTPTLSSRIVITYTGTLLNGMVFDQRLTPNNTEPTGSNAPWALSDLVEAWRIGIPLVKKGGHIKLIVPSAMGYGCTGYGSIPGNAILYFDINLVDVLP